MPAAIDISKARRDPILLPTDMIDGVVNTVNPVMECLGTTKLAHKTNSPFEKLFHGILSFQP